MLYCNYFRLEIVTSIISIKLLGSPVLLMFNMNLKNVDQQFYRIDTATVNLVRFTNDRETGDINPLINMSV
jgi:hypothetical protein